MSCPARAKEATLKTEPVQTSLKNLMGLKILKFLRVRVKIRKALIEQTSTLMVAAQVSRLYLVEPCMPSHFAVGVTTISIGLNSSRLPKSSAQEMPGDWPTSCPRVLAGPSGSRRAS